jgi:hypothetical protein
VAEVLPFSEAELRLLETLLRHKIRFLVVGLSAARTFDCMLQSGVFARMSSM